MKEFRTLIPDGPIIRFEGFSDIINNTHHPVGNLKYYAFQIVDEKIVPVVISIYGDDGDNGDYYGFYQKFHEPEITNQRVSLVDVLNYNMYISQLLVNEYGWKMVIDSI